MSLSGAFAGLEPASLWGHFQAITKIARPSGQEQAMAEFVIAWARARGLQTRRDTIGNLVVDVPATPGREKAPVVVLQGHLDMVCERDADSPNDPEHGRIEVVKDGDWLRAEGTTLGADNGIAIATMMAIPGDPAIQHGPLELLMTLDEERGLSGAQNLDPQLLRGRIMLNLDSEDDGVLFVGCAGGTDVVLTLEFARITPPNSRPKLQLKFSGAKGGHSGIDINKNRVNANKALARLLSEAQGSARFLIASFDGGNKRNAIPREARAVVFVPPAEEPAFRAALEASLALLKEQYRGIDDQLQLVIESIDRDNPEDAFGHADSLRLLDLIAALPCGVWTMSQDIAGLVETSSNVGVVTTRGASVEVANLSRTSNAPALRDVIAAICGAGRNAGAKAEVVAGYPGWKPNLQSKALKTTQQVFEQLYGKRPEVTAIHAGLECGIIGERYPGMDMVSFGPTLVGVHAPGEKIQISTVGRYWKLLAGVLDALSR
jgi:dipeptidase D